MRQWASDFWTFLKAMVPRTAARLTGGSIVALTGVFFALGHNLAHWGVWSLVALAVFAAAFTAWRDEYNRNKQLQSEELLGECAKLIASGEIPLRALILVGAHKLRTNRELVLLCNDLVAHNHAHPFKGDTWRTSLYGPTEDNYLAFLKQAYFRGFGHKDSRGISHLLSDISNQELAERFNNTLARLPASDGKPLPLEDSNIDEPTPNKDRTV